MTPYDSISRPIEILYFEETAIGAEGVEAAFKKIYNASSILRNAVDTWLNDHPGQHIVIEYRPGDASSPLNSGHVFIDPALIENTKYIDVNGQVRQMMFDAAIAHELGHGVEGFVDNWDWQNPKGQTF